MTTRLHMEDGTTFDVDEETEAVGVTHFNGSAVVRREFVEPTEDTKARAAEAPAEAGADGETPAEKRARLQAELDQVEG